MPVIIDGTAGITSPGGDTATVSVATPIVKSPGSLTLQTNGSTTALTIDTSQNVGVGVVPNAWTLGKSVSVGDVGTAIFGFGGYGALTSGAYYNSGWRYSNSTNKPTLFTGSDGGFGWNTATTTGTAGNTFTLTQILAVEVGKSLALQGATSQTGTGITFPATANLSTNANTLDDYEEGTYTMTWTANTGSITLGTNTCTYTKIGRLVVVSGYVAATSVSSPGGVLQLSLPFVSAPSGAARASVYLAFNQINGGYTLISSWGIIDSNSSYCTVYNGNGSSVVANFANAITASTDCRILMTYITDL